MKKMIASALVTAAILVPMAGAKSNGKIYGNGYTCSKTMKDIVCVRNDGRYYGIGFSHNVVTVVSARTHKPVLARYMP